MKKKRNFVYEGRWKYKMKKNKKRDPIIGNRKQIKNDSADELP